MCVNVLTGKEEKKERLHDVLKTCNGRHLTYQRVCGEGRNLKYDTGKGQTQTFDP